MILSISIVSLAGAMQGAVSQGVLWGIMTLGVYLTFRILNIADMTCDGSFALGGSVSAILLTKSMNPYMTLPVAFAAGMLAGLVTGILHTKLKIDAILASILTMIALYSINIRIMGRSNTPLLGIDTIMSQLQTTFGLSPNASSLLTGAVFSVLLIAFLYWFCGTEIGSALRATGNNPNMVRAMGADTDLIKLIGFALSNGLIALSGALVAQSQGYGDVGMGTGTIVIGLASIILGEVLLGAVAKKMPFWFMLFSVIFGSIVYRIVIAVVLQMGLKSSDLKLLTAIIVAISLSIPVIKRKCTRRRIANPDFSAESKEDK